MLLLFSFILRNSGSFLTNIVIGVLVGLMFAQRAVSFLYIIPVIIYYIFVFGKNLKPYIFLLVGYSFIVLLIGYKNFNETKHFHVLSKLHQYVSYYHYFAPSIYADRLNISSKEAQKILSENENKWMDENNIDLNNFEDLEKNIEYRNQIFFDEV